MSRILIVDDNDDVLEELTDLVNSKGHDYEKATCQEQALEMLGDTAFDLVLLDLQIPVKFEGTTRIEHGKNLCQRIFAMPDRPDVIVITSHGLNGWQLAVEMQELGAATFCGKPFDQNPIGPKIDKVLAQRAARSKSEPESAKAPFEGGTLVVHPDSITLNGQVVGGIKGNAYIRRVIELLSASGEKGGRARLQAGEMAQTIGSHVSAPVVTSAINDFRRTCKLKLGCGQHEVILSHRSGGYQLADWIEVKLGRDEPLPKQIDSDRQAVIRQLKRHRKRTRRQISDATGISVQRVKLALSALETAKKIALTGTGSGAEYSLKPED